MNLLAYCLDLLTFMFPQFAPNTLIYNADFGNFHCLAFFNWIQTSGAIVATGDFLTLLGDLATWNTFVSSLAAVSETLGDAPGVSTVLGVIKSSVAAITAMTFINALDDLFKRLIPGYATIAGLRVILYSSIHIKYFTIPVGHNSYGNIYIEHTDTATDWVYESAPSGSGSGSGSGGSGGGGGRYLLTPR